MKLRLALVVAVLAPLAHAQTPRQFEPISPIIEVPAGSVQNEKLRIDYDQNSHQFSAVTLPDEKVFLTGGALFPVTRAYVLKAEGGTAASLELSGDNGETVTLRTSADAGAMFLVEATIRNPGKFPLPRDLHDVSLIWFESKFYNKGNLVVRGTGGLHHPEEYVPPAPPSLVSSIWSKITQHHDRPPTGSYEWLAVSDPQARNGIVAGFTSHKASIGLLTPRWAHGRFIIAESADFGSPKLEKSDTAKMERLAIGYFDDVRKGLEQYADLVASTNQIKLPSQPSGYTTWYAEEHGGSGDEKSLAELTAYIDKNLRPWGMNFVQIDDGWQSGISHEQHRGPNKIFSDFNHDGPFKSGMKSAADEIRAANLTPGLWLLPFSADAQDPFFADKPNLFAQKSGKPYDTPWGGTCLDLSTPAAQQFLTANVTNIVHNWGFNYLKIDGLYTGLGVHQVYVSSDYNGDDDFGQVIFSKPDQTPVEIYRSGLQLIRQAAGPGTFILGCNTAQNMRVFGPSMGLVDAMRIGPDNAGDWKSWLAASPLFGSREYFLNGRVWYNDPDPCYVRASLTLDEARTTASWTSISGQLYTNSDWLPALRPERLDILRRTLAPHGKTARPVDFLENDPPRIWEVLDEKSGRYVLALFNWSDTESDISVPFDQLDIPKASRYAAFDFWANQFLPEITAQTPTSFHARLPPHACQVIALRPIGDHPFVLSTSAHVTQGMTDIVSEHWDPATKILSGRSHVVANAPYELRLATPDPAQKFKSFTVDYIGMVMSPDAKREALRITTPVDIDHRASFIPALQGPQLDVVWKLQY